MRLRNNSSNFQCVSSLSVSRSDGKFPLKVKTFAKNYSDLSIIVAQRNVFFSFPFFNLNYAKFHVTQLECEGMSIHGKILSAESSMWKFLSLVQGVYYRVICVRGGQNYEGDTLNVTRTLRGWGNGVNPWTLRNPFCIADRIQLTKWKIK